MLHYFLFFKIIFSVGKVRMFLGCLSIMSRLSVRRKHLSGQILLPRSLMNGLSGLDKTYGEYSKAPTDNLIRF